MSCWKGQSPAFSVMSGYFLRHCGVKQYDISNSKRMSMSLTSEAKYMQVLSVIERKTKRKQPSYVLLASSFGLDAIKHFTEGG
ncbi:hypothetical protein BKA69DRAFT_401245 [Paraphysoderma sedebokerense]|nr:hypothetical protein BKA69DRAFT_941294 [Paraphysoderma sedebokerense]KAI9141550.1 hypothetical protein BKA69DRAFT_401245 [Paraphysoderma sedebokerense]